MITKAVWRAGWLAGLCVQEGKPRQGSKLHKYLLNSQSYITQNQPP